MPAPALWVGEGRRNHECLECHGAVALSHVRPHRRQRRKREGLGPWCDTVLQGKGWSPGLQPGALSAAPVPHTHPTPVRPVPCLASSVTPRPPVPPHPCHLVCAHDPFPHPTPPPRLVCACDPSPIAPPAPSVAPVPPFPPPPVCAPDPSPISPTPRPVCGRDPPPGAAPWAPGPPLTHLAALPPRPPGVS